MTFEKPRFYNLLSEGRSLVFVPTRSLALAVADTINNTGTIKNVAFHISPLHPLEEALHEMAKPEMKFANLGVIVAHPAQANHGFRIQVDRLVWVGPIPKATFHSAAMYEQSMARGDFWPHYFPAKWHYTEQEAGFGVIDE